MEPTFWHERWERDEIGFHEAQPNRHLVNLWPALAVPAGAPVLVPLCGKSVDLQWLRLRGHLVVGVELSKIAVEAFFNENQLSYQIENTNTLNRYHTDGIEIWQGDIFNLTPEQLPEIQAVYDRAALIALPDEMRQDYVDQIQKLCPNAANMLVVVMESPQSDNTRPPFSIDSQQIHQLFGAAYLIERLVRDDVLNQYPALIRRGFKQLHETVYQLVKK